MARLEAIIGNLSPDSESLAIIMYVNSLGLVNLKSAYDRLARHIAEKIGSILDNVAVLARELMNNISP